MRHSVIVVGGGIIGTSIAYYLSKQDVDVTLVEARDIAAGTSGSCDRAIMLQSKKPGPALDLAFESAKMYAHLEEELEANLEYREGGGMILVETPEEQQAIEHLLQRQRTAGLEVEFLSGDEARAKQPGLSKQIIGSTWWAKDAEVNPLSMTFAMARNAQKRGAMLKLGSEVVRLLVDRHRVIGVETKHEKLYADAVVVALGVWTPQLFKPLGIDIPIIPRRGQILVSERIPPFIQCNILSGAYMASKLGVKQTESTDEQSAGVGLAIGQTESGTLLIGGSREFVGFDHRTTPEVTRAIASAAVRAFPKLANVRIIRTFSGLRPYTPDNLPILGGIEGLEGVYVSAGHEGDGIALAPITGKIMAALACGIDPGVELSPFSYHRFSRDRN